MDFLEIALSAAKLEAFIADDAKEEEINRISKQRRKWDCFHVATAQFYGCSDFYAIDSKMLNRGSQLSIKNMEFSKPEPRSTPLFKGLNAGGLALHD